MKVTSLCLAVLTLVNQNVGVSGFVPSSSFVSRQPLMTRSNIQNGSSMNMMFDQLSSAITNVAQSFGGRSRLTEGNISQALVDVRRALLDADVNIQVADTLIEGVKRRSVGVVERVKGVTADQQFVKLMYDELLEIMGGDASKSGDDIPAATLARGEDMAVVLLAGLQGAGKTTAAGKLALYLKEREVEYGQMPETAPGEAPTLNTRLPKTNRKVLLVGADIYRPAAMEQLKILGDSIGVPVYIEKDNTDAVEICQNALKYAKENDFDTVLVDTAGRQVVDADLMTELRNIQQTIQPDETLLVVDSMTGQEAASLTASFDNAVGLTGAILTKIDGDSRGGAAVSVRAVSGKPIKFVGTGEKVDDLEPFYPNRMASRILGMGDIVSLVEKAALDMSDADAKKMEQKMKDAQFDFDDFQKQSEMVGKMGSLAGVAKMLPGMGNMLNNSQMAEVEKRLARNSAMIQSMTPKERANPDLLIKDRTARSRVQRISLGAGCSIDQGVAFMSEFQKMRTMMSRMSKQAGAMGGGGEGLEEEMATAPSMGNRKMRRKQKKGKKGGRGGGKGFGA